MTASEVAELLGPLLKDGVLDVKAAVSAAYNAGFKEADRTHTERQRQSMYAQQMNAVAR